jgi:fibronectin type 3 domain-containing protein
MQGIVLKWQKSNSQDLAKTVLYRKSELDFKYYPIREFEADSLVIMSYLDTNVKARTRYAYVLQSVDISGLKSEMSPELNVQMLDNAKIPRPTNLEGMASKENRMIKLTWELDANAKGYKLYRAENGEQLLSYTYISGNVREYYDKTLKPNTQYTYVLVAELPNNIKSGYSNKLIIKY